MSEAAFQGGDLLELAPINEAQQILRCPICLSVPVPPVYFNCATDHLKCGKCCPHVQRCGNCRLEYLHGHAELLGQRHGQSLENSHLKIRSPTKRSKSKRSTRSRGSVSTNRSRVDNKSPREDVVSSSKIKRNKKAWSEWLSDAKYAFEKRWNNAKAIEGDGKLRQFKLVRTLGSGTFGRVLQVQYKPSREYYAMKVMEKAKIIKLHQVEHIMNEKRVLYSIRFPFIVRMAWHFKDNSNVYMVMEFVNGGEMFTHLRDANRYPETQARFYAGQVLLAFEYLHSLDIAYRDVKPENILIDSKGYLKIVDFGFAKRFKGRTYTMCGTPEYLAPEIIKNKGYNKAVDWWAFGVLIFEMTTGSPPFEHEDQMRLYEKIVEGKLRYPSYMSEDLKEILGNLIMADLTKRYGNLKRGVNDIKDHRWFETMDWMDLFRQKIKPSFVPETKGSGDNSNFDKYKDKPIVFAKSNQYTKEFEDF